MINISWVTDRSSHSIFFYNSKHGTWSVTVKIPAGEEIHFRYCVALFVDAHAPMMSHQIDASDFSDDGTKTVIRRYELEKNNVYPLEWSQ